MFNLNQWVTWEPVQYPDEPKPRKIPCGYRNAHDPVNWMPYETARAITDKTGFVFTQADPYFFVDVDHALDANGAWLPIVQTVCNMFPGAYMETGFSGDGIHVIAQGVVPDGFKTKNAALGLECYDRLRYAAITGVNAIGTPDINHQAALTAFVMSYMEVNVATAPAQWTNGPRSDWNGPTDDDELIDKFLKSRPSVNAIFGGTATLRDLWEGNQQALIDSYPDGVDGYDESSPDMALATHLAFWTGCDCERIERLMWRSGLVREKWTGHKTYLREFTISKAVAGCQNVYSDPRALVEAPVGTSTADTPLTPSIQLRHGLQYLTPDAQIEYFKGCVYIIKTHTILRPNGIQVSPEQFKVIYGGYLFAMDTVNDKTTKCAWEAFTKSYALTFPKVETLLFRPEMIPGTVIEYEGVTAVNSYYPVPIKKVDGDVSLFLDLLNKLFPDDRDRLIILSYMAACVQHIGSKFQWAPLVQGTEGNGKSFLMEAIIQSVGSRLSHSVNPKDIGSVYNAWIEGKVFVGIEEVHTSDKRDLIDALKILITNRRLEIQAKYGNQYMGDNCANFFMNTNFRDAIRKTRNDRRYAPFFTPQQSYEDVLAWGMGGTYLHDLYEWARAGGYACIAHYLTNFDIPDDMNPATKLHRAPQTSSTNMAIKASQGPIEQEIENAIGENRQGFRGGWISSMQLEALLQRTNKARLVPQGKRTEMLVDMGYVHHGRSTVEIPVEHGRPVLYALKEMPVGNDLAMEYMIAQGYIAP